MPRLPLPAAPPPEAAAETAQTPAIDEGSEVPRPSLTRARVLLWAIVAAAGLGAGWLLSSRPDPSPTDTLGQGGYRLATTDGEAFTEASLQGAPSAVFFGFASCPEVCPTTMGDIATWQAALGPEGERLRVFFVTVDPERDTIEALGDHVSRMPGVTGVSGSQEEMDEALQAFRVYARRVPVGDDYTMDHSAMVLLFDADGRFFRPIGYQEDPERATASLRQLLQG